MSSISPAPSVGATAEAAPNGTAADTINTPSGCPMGSPEIQRHISPPAAPPTAAGPTYGKADLDQLANLPDTIKRCAPCCVWRTVPRPGSDKPAKVPYDPKTGQPAKPGDLSTFGRFAEAMAALSAGRYNGIGIAVVGTVGAIDIDHCIRDSGELSAMAQDIVTTMDTYTEVSPSGHGIRILFTVPAGFAFDVNRYYINSQARHLEVYVAGATQKYVTLTGNTQTPGKDLAERGEALMKVLDKYMQRPQPQTVPAPTPAADPSADPAATQAADQHLLDTIMQTFSGPRLAALLNGDLSEYGNDHSAVDMAACNILAAHTDDPNQIDRIIRNSALMRSKWDRAQSGSTYGRITIDKAVSSARQYRQAHGELTQEQMQSVFVQAVTQGTPPSQQASPFVAGTAALAMLAPPKPKCISAKELASLQLPQTVYLINEILPEGTTIFTGPSKARKSFEVLAIGLDIAAGIPHMQLSTTKCGVLYLALEDSWARIQGRMMGILAGRPVPDDFYFWTEAPSLDMGLQAALDEHLKQHPEVRLVIIDTFQRIRGAAKRGESSYATDYREMCALKTWALGRGVSILLVHHNRKMTDPDAFNMISGTNGIMGSADTIWVITKDKRMDDTATLHITGRDVLPQELAIRFDDSTLRWECLGSADTVQAQRQKADYASDELALTVKQLVATAPNHEWTGSATEILRAGQAGRRLMGLSPQKLGYRLRDILDDLEIIDGISYRAIPANGSSVKHMFYSHSAPMLDSGNDPDEDAGDDE